MLYFSCEYGMVNMDLINVKSYLNTTLEMVVSAVARLGHGWGKLGISQYQEISESGRDAHLGTLGPI